MRKRSDGSTPLYAPPSARQEALALKTQAEHLERTLDEIRQRIVELTDALRKQHLQTVLLLAECARFNRLLLESILPGGEMVMTYGTGGSDLWRSGTGLVDTEL